MFRSESRTVMRSVAFCTSEEKRCSLVRRWISSLRLALSRASETCVPSVRSACPDSGAVACSPATTRKTCDGLLPSSSSRERTRSSPAEKRSPSSSEGESSAGPPMRSSATSTGASQRHNLGGQRLHAHDAALRRAGDQGVRGAQRGDRDVLSRGGGDEGGA